MAGSKDSQSLCSASKYVVIKKSGSYLSNFGYELLNITFMVEITDDHRLLLMIIVYDS